MSRLLEGTKEVVVSVVFRVPPGIAPELVVQMIATSGVSVALGLGSYLKSVETDVRDVVVPAGPSLMS